MNMIAQTETSNNALWEYKFRPKTVNECVLPQRLKDFFNAIVDSKKLPNLLLSSQKPGTGKTTVAHALTNQLDFETMFINASVENGIDLVRTKIPNFCRQTSLSGKPKAIILDEADNLSADAQKALRGCIDEFSGRVRFILTCNYKQNLSEPLQSRFNLIEFAFSADEITECIKQAVMYNVNILRAEGVKLSSPKVILELVKQHAPNNRSVVVLLQQYAAGGREIDEGVLAEVSKQVDVTVIVEAIKNKQFKVIREVAEKFGDNADAIIIEVYNSLVKEVTPQSIPTLIEAIGESNRAMTTVVSKKIELTYLFVQLMVQLTFK